MHWGLENLQSLESHELASIQPHLPQRTDHAIIV